MDFNERMTPTACTSATVGTSAMTGLLNCRVQKIEDLSTKAETPTAAGNINQLDRQQQQRHHGGNQQQGCYSSIKDERISKNACKSRARARADIHYKFLMSSFF
jgi:hypothetical protein